MCRNATEEKGKYPYTRRYVKKCNADKGNVPLFG